MIYCFTFYQFSADGTKVAATARSTPNLFPVITAAACRSCLRDNETIPTQSFWFIRRFMHTRNEIRRYKIFCVRVLTSTCTYKSIRFSSRALLFLSSFGRVIMTETSTNAEITMQSVPHELLRSAISPAQSPTCLYSETWWKNQHCLGPPSIADKQIIFSKFVWSAGSRAFDGGERSYLLGRLWWKITR